ncbi:MAG: hypothetical protein KGJ79_04625 [Alphaproteobacteria bacterium]|nr:hypothetical protein [Alphaproteobacteria bacterium]MDE2493435.1 hypothetical protein [Alphaproteobacteria bacterium]
MSIISGLVDMHHEMELTPSAHLIARNWFARHLWAIMVICIAIALYVIL